MILVLAIEFASLEEERTTGKSPFRFDAWVV